MTKIPLFHTGFNFVYLALIVVANVVSITGVLADQESDFAIAGEIHSQRLVHIEANNDACNLHEAGFGYVVGESDTDLFVSLPDHVIRKPQDSSIVNGVPTDGECRAITVSLRYFQNGVVLSRTYRYSEVVRGESGDKHETDVTFILVPKPDGWRSSFPNLAGSFSSARGTNLRFVGYKHRALVPLSSGQVLDECDQTAGQACEMFVEGLGTEPGYSGAPVFDRDGILYGQISKHAGGGDSLVLRIDEVRRSADLYSIPWNIYSTREEGKLGVDLIKALSQPNRKLITKLLNKRFNMDRAYQVGEGQSGTTPIDEAAWRRKFGIVRSMVILGARKTSLAGRIAAEAGEIEIVRFLMESEVELSCILAASIYEKQPNISDAILVEPLMQSLHDINELCYWNRTALFWALVNDYPETALKIVKAGADPNLGQVEQSAVEGFPLTLAILRGYDAVIEGLLEKGARVDVVEYPSDLSPRQFDIFGPLHAAAYIGDLALVESLIARGANPDIHSTTDQGRKIIGGSPIEAAMLGGNIEIVKYLYYHHEAGLLGYRYPESLIKDIAGAAMSAGKRREIERFISDNLRTYCKKIYKDHSKRPGYRNNHLARLNCDYPP